MTDPQDDEPDTIEIIINGIPRRVIVGSVEILKEGA